MGVSRGPIREALLRLEREGLLVIRRNRGAIVAQLAREDLEEVYTLRVVLERLAIERAVQFGDESTFARLQVVVDEIRAVLARGITEQEGADLDVRFHDLIYQAADHRRLAETWANLRPQIHVMLLSRNVAHADFHDYVVTSHQAILDAMRARDAGLAVSLIEEHLRGGYERVLAAYEQRSPDGATKTGRRGGGLNGAD
jgi:DNA-binding GntR family transcriptional regulator